MADDPTAHSARVSLADVAALSRRAAPRDHRNTLDEGEPPTLRDLTERLFFSPSDGRIWLDEQRMILFHASALGALRRELIESLGHAGARGMLTRIGYAAGARDAQLVRKRWSDSDDAGTFTAGMRLHALQGLVKVTTIFAKFDIPRGIFHGSYLWHNSSEAAEHIASYGIVGEPACWMQIGYASGYASAFFGKLIIYREIECRAMGAPVCRIVGKPAAEWDFPEEDLTYLNPDLFARTAIARSASDQAAPAARVPATAPPAAAPATDTGMVGASAAFSAARHMIDRVAPTQATVLFTGESGVGKELFAKALHRISPRAHKPFVAVNCAAIPDTLVESELFGVEKGAFTGATASRAGRFERAGGGTLLLDEIQALSLFAQGKLLRAVQEREIERVGGTAPIKVDVRIVVATNQDLAGEVRAGRFREDLYYRLNVFPIPLPPLRERRDDIPLLLDHFLAVYNRQHGKNVIGFSRRASETLLNYDYPGNVRELQNMVERAVISGDNGGNADLHHLFRDGEYPRGRTLIIDEAGMLSGPEAGAEAVDHGESFSLPAHEADLYRRALDASGGNIAAAARRLGITRAQLAYRLRKLAPAAE